MSVRGANPYVLGAMGTAGMIFFILLQILVGRLAGKIGQKKSLLLVPSLYLSGHPLARANKEVWKSDGDFKS